MEGLFWGVMLLLFIGWFLGLVFHFAGDFIHALLLIILIVLAYRLLANR